MLRSRLFSWLLVVFCGLCVRPEASAASTAFGFETDYWIGDLWLQSWVKCGVRWVFMVKMLTVRSGFDPNPMVLCFSLSCLLSCAHWLWRGSFLRFCWAQQDVLRRLFGREVGNVTVKLLLFMYEQSLVQPQMGGVPLATQTSWERLYVSGLGTSWDLLSVAGETDVWNVLLRLWQPELDKSSQF